MLEDRKWHSDQTIWTNAMFLKPKIYYKIMSLHDKAEKLYFREQTVEAASIADQCIAIYKNNTKELDKYIYRDTLLGNMLWIRAAGKTRQLQETPYQYNTVLRDSTLDDFIKSYEHLSREQEQDSSKALAGLGIDFAVFSVLFYDKNEEGIAKFATERVIYSINFFNHASQPKVKAMALIELSKVYLNFYAPKNKQYEFKAIHCLEEALGLYKKHHVIVENICECSLLLIASYLLPNSRLDQSNVLKAINLLDDIETRLKEEKIHSETKKYLLYQVYSKRGDMYHHLTTGERTKNLQLSEINYGLGIDQLEDIIAVQANPMTILTWIDLLVENGNFYDYQEKAEKFLILTEEFINNFNDSDIKNEILYKLTRTKRQVNSAKLGDIETINNQYRLDIQTLQKNCTPRSNSTLWVDNELTLIMGDYKKDKDHINALKRFKKIRNNWQESYNGNFEVRFRAYFLYGYFLAKSHAWKAAKDNFSKAFGDLDKNLGQDFRAFSEGRQYSFPLHENELRELPIVLLDGKLYEEALIYFELLYSRRVANTMETLLLIDISEPATKVYVSLKYHDYITAQMMASQGKINNIERLQRVKEFENILNGTKQQCSHLTRNYAFKSLSNMMKDITVWQFIPILGNDYSKLVIIPPQSDLSDITIIHNDHLNFQDEFKKLINHKGMGLMEMLTHSDDEAMFEQIYDSFSDLISHLWEMYGQYIASTIKSSSTGNTDVCIIATGSLVYFPFCMAESNGEHILDYSSLSYSPSTYALWALLKRASMTDENDRIVHLSFINSAKSDDLEFTDTEYLLCCPSFEQENCHKYEVANQPVELEKALRYGNHWHFSVHGSYDFRSRSLTTLSLGDLEIPSDKIYWLARYNTPRLVFMAACETGIQDFTNGSEDPEGFFESFLTIGTLGVIGVLWKQPDISAALISGYFYHFYNKQGCSPAQALRQAQLSVKNKTVAELITDVKSLSHVEDSHIIDWLGDEYDHKPFDHPMFWAGYILVGI